MADDQQQTDQQQETLPAVRKPTPPLVADDRGILPVIPRDTLEAARYADGLIAANIVPDAYREGGKKDNPPNKPLILMGVLKAMELGMAPQTGLGTIMPINGRFTVWGDGAVALIQRHRLISKQTAVKIGPAFDPSTPLGDWPDDYGYEVRYWRVAQDEPYIGRFTVREARRASLWNNSYKKPWMLYPDRMLFNRARAFALRDGFADALMGLGIAEEVRDMLTSEEDATRPAKVADTSALDDEPVTAATPAPVIEHPELEDEPVRELGGETLL